MLSRAFMTPSARGHAGRRATATALAALLAAAVALPGAAAADVRRGDLIMGETVEQRDIPAGSCPSIDAQYAALIDGDGTVLFGRGLDTPTHIASITKIMTAIVALEQGLLEEEVTVSAEAASVGESTAGLWAGDKMTLLAALNGMLVPSGNDAAYAIGETLGARMATEGQSPLDAFVAAMNETAAKIGMGGTLFSNPHGLDDGEFDAEMHSTAADVAVMSRYAMGFDTFASIVAQPSVTIEVTRGEEKVPIELTSTDELIGVYEGACGIKTGTTDAAGPSFAGACKREAGTLYATVLASSSEAQRFADAQALYNWYYGNLVDYPLAHSDEKATMATEDGEREVPVVAEVACAAWPDKTVKATFADPDQAVEVFALQGNVSQAFELDPPAGAVRAGDRLGRALFYQANELVAEAEVVACEDVPAPGFLENVSIAWSRFWDSLGGKPTMAESVVLNDTPLIYDKAPKVTN